MSQERNPFKRPLSRRQTLQLMGGLAGMAALAACAPVGPAAPADTGSEGEAAAPAQTGGTMVVGHRKEYFEEMETQFVNAVTAWAAENNVEVETTVVAAEAFEDFVAKTAAAVEAGTPPDFIYHIRLVQQLYFLNALEPVDDVVEKAIELYGEIPPLNAALNSVEGGWWGVPFSVHGGGQFARRDVFEAAGIDPESLQTYDQRRDAALAVSDAANEMYGWGLTVNRSGDGTGFIMAVIHNWGGTITNAEMTELTFNSPETVAAVEWLGETYTSDQYAPMLPPGILSWTDSSNNEAYLAGNIAYTSNAASFYAQAKRDGNPVFENTVALEAAMGPTNTHLNGASGGQIVIPRGAKFADLSRDLALHMITPEVFLPMSSISAGLFLPSYQSFYDMEEVKSAFAADPNLARMGSEAFGNYSGMPYPAQPSPYFDAIDAQTVITDMIAQVTTAGVSAADAVSQATDRMQQIAEEMGAFG